MRQAPHGRAEHPRASPPPISAATVALAAIVALALAPACAPPRDDDLFGITLEVHSSQAWALDPDLRRRIHDLVEESCAYMGLDPSALYGMTLRIEDGEIPCGDVTRARGCTWREQGIIAVSTLPRISLEPRVPCVEDTPIPHELLHVKIADAQHRDPRWESADYWVPLFERATRSDCSGDPPTLIW